MALQVTTRADRQRERIARLLDQAMSAADAWVQATYACGIEDGRGVRSVHVARQRDLAERRFRDIAAKLVAEQTRHRSLDMLRVYFRRADLFRDHAGAGFL